MMIFLAGNRAQPSGLLSGSRPWHLRWLWTLAASGDSANSYVITAREKINLFILISP